MTSSRKGRAFCPGHITAFFEACDHEEPLKRGSRGAGFCISLGVHTEVEVREAGEQEVGIWINGRKRDAETTELVVRRIIGSRGVDVKVRSVVELPVSQGFGMSGAGALSTAYALNEALRLKLGKQDLIQIAHVAEVEAMTGLGDVYPQGMGGMDTRLSPGAPPHGKLVRRTARKRIVLCIVGRELRTKRVLADPVMRTRINDIGRECVDDYIGRPSWPKLFELSREFARRTKLASRKILKALEEVESCGGKAGMVMLGNSVFASGDEKRLIRALQKHGKAFSCAVDNKGARLIRQA
ncbi:MAG: hypothetical protein KAI64_02220 [Thermoplasmata archaeon]|nr:hypothetical protein [Thermoplasmata archaeon]